ncbi:hypothetical protein AgCh_016302 [Apium graveolens]
MKGQMEEAIKEADEMRIKEVNEMKEKMKETNEMRMREVDEMKNQMRQMQSQLATVLDSWSDQIGGQVRPMCALDPVIRAELCAFLGIAAMTDSFIPVPADHSEPSIGGPSSDQRPVAPPMLAILPLVVLQPVPLQAIPPPGMRPPIRGPPPADSGFTGHLVTGVPF